MKILVIDPADFLGGAELFSSEIISELKDKVDFTVVKNCKHSPKASCCLPPDKGGLRGVNTVDEKTKTVYIEIPRLRPFRPICLIKSVFALRNHLKENPVDIVHSNSVRAGIVASLLGERWTHFAHDFTLPKFLAWRFKKADHIFCCSEAVQKDLMQKGIQKLPPDTCSPWRKWGLKNRMTIVPNGIETERFSAISKKKWNSEKPVIAIVGRIDRWKGQDVFLKTARELKKTFSKADFRIYGQSSKYDEKTVRFEKELKEYVKENGLKNIRFMGQKPVDQILGEIDILVHASTKPEPFGRVVLEALASGIPIIASDLGGPKEILTGEILKKLLISPNDSRLLAKKIMWIIEDKNFRKEYEQSAQKRAKDFEMKKVAEKMLAIWGKL